MNGADGSLTRKRNLTGIDDDSRLSTGALDSAVAVKKPRVDAGDENKGASGAHTRTNGDSDAEDGEQSEDDQLELFRKEAIWREMQEFKRKLDRAQRTVDQLETDKAAYEARLSAVDIVWTQLVNEAEMLLPSTSVAAADSKSAISPSLSNPGLGNEELAQALAQRSAATRSLLSKLTSLSTSTDPASKVNELEQKCRALLEQSLASQETLRALRQKHESTVKQLEQTIDELVRAEKKFDRFRSKTVRAVESRSSDNNVASSKNASPAPTAVTAAATGAGSSTGDVAKAEADGSMEEGEVVSSASVLNGATHERVLEIEMLLQSRAKEVDELRQDRTSLKKEVDSLKMRLKDLPEDAVVDSTPFKTLQSHVQYLNSEVEMKRTEMERLAKEADGYREQQETFRVKTMRDAKGQLDDLQKRLNQRESDLSRIRAQREDLRTEATQLKAKDWDKIKFVESIKTLNKSQAERLVAYESQVKRLRMQVAADRGDLAMVENLAKTNDEDLVSDLQKRLKTAEELLLALREQLTNYTKGTGTNAENIAQSEERAREELAQTQSKLAKLEALFTSSDTSELATKLQKAEERVRVLEAQAKSSAESSNMLYSEIERLSLAWSTLEEQNAQKVWNLTHTEEKIQKLAVEATMREKEALMAENAVLTKLAEKQQKAVAGADDLQDSLRQQLLAAEKEITLHQQNVRAHQDYIASAKREKAEFALKLEQQVKQLADLKAILHDRVDQAETAIVARQKADDRVAKLERELAGAKSTLSTFTSGSTSSGSVGGGTAETRQLREYNADLQEKKNDLLRV
ncbi:E3 ubiquitin-protein ligase bre1 [Microbotryomycetes sp. JL201]|nr:E3 ubiquitin-protein ligase bre1 [Microbotryomycetes sp. JL201]